MLTPEKVATYRRFRGDIDGYARAEGVAPSGITDEEWGLIGELQQALFLVSSGRAAPEFAASLEQRLLSVAPDEPTRRALKELAS